MRGGDRDGALLEENFLVAIAVQGRGRDGSGSGRQVDANSYLVAIIELERDGAAIS